MAVESGPGSALKVIEAEFFLELLMGLLADLARLDRASERALTGVSAGRLER